MRLLPLLALLLISCSKSPRLTVLSSPPAETREAMKVLPRWWQFHEQSPVLYESVRGEGGPFHVYLQKTIFQTMSISYRVYIFDQKFNAVLFGEVTATQGEEPYEVVWANPPEVEFRVPSVNSSRRIAMAPMSVSHIREEEAQLEEIGKILKEMLKDPNAFDENRNVRPEVNAAAQKAIEEIRSRRRPLDEIEAAAPSASPNLPSK